MATLTIKNIGPVRDVSFTLNKINVFIGPQSCGKSTIAKIISYCFWLEKDCLIRQSVEHVNKSYLIDTFLRFYRIDCYFSSSSYIKYDGRAISFEYDGGTVVVKRSGTFSAAVVSKVAYVPAERIVDVLPNLKGVQFSPDYLQSFVFDWMDMRSYYGKQNALEIVGMRIKYYFDMDSGNDMIQLENGKSVVLSQASSGLQSTVPLYVISTFLTQDIYKQKEKMSFERRSILQKSLDKVFYYYSEQIDKTRVEEPLSLGSDEVNKKVEKIRDNISRTHAAKIMLEEPELNVFPKSQMTLLQDTLRMVKFNRDILTFTTHSPYLLYGLNNMMLGYLVRDDIKAEDNEELLRFEDCFVNPQHVSVWEIKDGEFSSEETDDEKRIQDKRGLIRGNYFDRVMREVINDFNGFLN